MDKGTTEAQLERVLEDEKHQKPSGFEAEKDLHQRLLHKQVKDLDRDVKNYQGGY